MTDFQQAVARVLRALRPGEVVTYGEVAAEAGFPGAARAVGTFLRDSEGFPWWRVIRADGRLLAGKEVEQSRRLAAEGVPTSDGRIGRASVPPPARPRSVSSGAMSANPSADLQRWRFTVEEYERMGQAGILGEDDRVELLDGEIVSMTPSGPVRAGIVNRLNRMLVQRLGDRAVVAIQNPLRLAPHSEPQPDLTLARPRSDFYQLAHPGPDDVLLVIEVADSSLAVDRSVKVPVYARAAVPEVWLVDPAGRRVLVHDQPRDGAYARISTVRPGETLSPRAFGDVTLPVGDILGGV